MFAIGGWVRRLLPRRMEPCHPGSGLPGRPRTRQWIGKQPTGGRMFVLGTDQFSNQGLEVPTRPDPILIWLIENQISEAMS